MPKTYSHGGYSVTIADDGAIQVKPGDMLSKYSMAIHRDFNHCHEYGRKALGSSTITPVADINRISAGETLYHLPTADKNKNQPPVPPSLPKLVAVATDSYLTPIVPFNDATNLPGVTTMYGQDLLYSAGRAAPLGHSVGTTVPDLVDKMRKLLGEFASNDPTGMARRLFSQFLGKLNSVQFFDDASLNQVAAAHQNIMHFMNAALSAPNSPNRSAGKTRIHQALKNAGWDIAKLVAPTDLGVPAFNQGSKWRGTEDFGNGLGVMINGVQHVYVYATKFRYDAARQVYDISLKYLFYDVFGLDDDDLREYGAMSDGMASTTAGVGITAWWQLQHQHNYAPLVTRITIEKDFLNVPAQ